MNEKKRKLIEQAGKVFMRLGIKSVTMDDMARNLGISKKTLYQHVQDKNDLVMLVMNHKCSEEEKVIREICDRGLNAIDENFEISRWVVSQLKEVHPSIHFDMEKYHPEVFRHFRESHSEVIYECMVENMRKGIKEGLYREDLNADVITKVYLSRFDVVFDGHFFPSPEYNFADVYLEIFRYHVRGIASEKGIHYLVQKVKKEKQNL